MAMIRLDQVSKYYRSEDTVSVGMKDISLSFELGEFVAVTGESGSGKSTLLNVISGLDGYENGEMYLFDEETSHYTIADWERYRGTYVGFVFQNYNIIDSYTVLQNVLLALEIQGYDRHKRKQRALELIDKVGLTSHKHHRASKLSGGQKQRAVIARALAKDCPVIVADEPTGNLDSKSAEQVMNLLHDISKDKLVIVVTHDYDQVKPYATRKIKMHDGEVIEDRKIQAVEPVTLSEVPKPKRLGFLGLFRFTVRNLVSTPKKLIFMLLLQIIVIAVLTVVYTNQIASIREMGLTQSASFPSVPETRVLVEKRDGTEFTDDEINYFDDMRVVNAVYTEAMNFYNESTLYIKSLSESWYYRSLKGTDSDITLSSGVVDGRLPEAINEVVISTYYDYFEIGDFVTLHVGNEWYYDETNSSLGTFEIVGFDKLNRNIIYFDETFVKQTNDDSAQVDVGLLQQIEQNIKYDMELEIDGVEDQYGRDTFWSYYDTNYQDQLTTDLMFEGEGEYTTLTHQAVLFTLYDANYQPVTYTVSNVSVMVPETIWGAAMLSDDLYQILRTHFLDVLESQYTVTPKNYISLSVDGFYAGNKVIDTIDKDIYKVYYPANITGAMSEISVFFITFLAVIYLSLLGLFLYAIVHAVTKNVMAARKKDFAIYRSIGANKSTLARLVVLEQVLMSMIGFIITLIIMYIVSRNVYSIAADLQYMEFRDYLFLLAAFMLFGAWLGLRFNKKVFGQSVIETLSESRGE